MKRSPLRPGKPLARVTPLGSRAQLRRVTPLRQQSAKRKAENLVRRQVVADLFPERPRCARPGCTRLADDVHEPLTRARLGSITDPSNMIPLCRTCHQEVQLGPDWAYDLGLMIHSWDGGGAA